MAVGRNLPGIVLQLAAVYVPFLQRVLSTVPLSGTDWLVIAGFSLAVIPVVEVVKFVQRRAAMLQAA